MYEIIDNLLIHSRPQIQQMLLEIVYIKDWCVVDLLLHHASNFIIVRNYSNLDCSEAIITAVLYSAPSRKSTQERP